MLKPLLLGLITAAGGAAAADRITFYSDDNFGGRQFSADQPVSNFARNGFNDRISSAVARRPLGNLPRCRLFAADAAFFAPGAYPNLGAYAIASARSVRSTAATGTAATDAIPTTRRLSATRDALRGSESSGRAFPLNDAVANLAGPASTIAPPAAR
jgi:hypothetical protein